jgi:poly(ADP-ribose) glycohydrolase ARH3
VEQLVWWFIGRTTDGCHRWTDDTQMALDLAESLLAEGMVRPDALAKRFASSYRWSRGYGPGAARVLKRIRRGEPWEQASKAVYVEGSYGNGAAMRAPVLALFYARDRAGLLAAAHSSAQVTHGHPLGIEGAVLITLAAHGLLMGHSTSQVLDVVQVQCATPQFSERLKTVRAWLESEATPSPREVATKLGNGITATTSCPTAFYIALRHLKTSFEAMIKFIIACRGDVDTIGAMAGALWGIVNGAERLPQVRLEARDRVTEVASRLFQRNQSNNVDCTRATDTGLER